MSLNADFLIVLESLLEKFDIVDPLIFIEFSK